MNDEQLPEPPVTVDTDEALSFAAVGIWHKLRALGDGDREQTDLLLIQQSPSAWGPIERSESEPMDGPLDELVAQGYIEDIDGRLRLFHERSL